MLFSDCLYFLLIVYLLSLSYITIHIKNDNRNISDWAIYTTFVVLLIYSIIVGFLGFVVGTHAHVPDGALDWIKSILIGALIGSFVIGFASYVSFLIGYVLVVIWTAIKPITSFAIGYDVDAEKNDSYEKKATLRFVIYLVINAISFALIVLSRVI